MRFLLVWSLLLGSALLADTLTHSPVSSGVLSIQWKIDIPDSTDISFSSRGLAYPGWNATIVSNGIEFPVKSKLIYTSGPPPEFEYQLGSSLQLESTYTLIPQQEMAKGIDLSVAENPSTDFEMVTTKLVSETEGVALWAINVMGANYDEALGEWTIPRRVLLNIESDITSFHELTDEDIYLNSSPETTVSIQTNSQSGFGKGKFKLYVLEDGIYRIYYDSLASRNGFSGEAIPSRTLSLRQNGNEQAIYVSDGGDDVFGAGDYFDFIGRQKYFEGPSQYYDPFTDINVYWLDWGGADGLRLVEESGALVDSEPVRPQSFWDIQHIEEDIAFERLGQVDTDKPSITRDHYFWEDVNSGATKEVDFFLADPFRGSSENVEVSVGLHGLTYSEVVGEVKSHTLYAFLNDNSIGDASWVQQEEYVLHAPSALNLSHNILSSNGMNSLAIFAPVSTEPGNYDKIVLNWIKIGYEHLLQAHDDHLRFRKSFINPSTNLEFEIQGFSSHEMVVYKEGLSKITGFSIRENWDATLPTYSLVFQDEVTTATPDYWSSTVSGLMQPVKMVADTVADLRQQDGDFIIITIPAFTDHLEAYVTHKEEEGWNPVVVSVSDVYDEFNQGINSPFAIKSFLRYANNNWPSTPEHVLFIGDAISNPQQTKRDTRIRNIPTFYMQTYGWGAGEADYWFSLINGNDYLPDLHIGRIPCSNMEDLEISLNKLIKYGSSENFGSWQNELITIAGFDATFKAQTESLLRSTIPKAFIPSRIFIDRDSEGQIFWGDTDSLVEQWNQGKMLINFLGHGGGAVWADRSLFVRDDINYLDASTPPALVTSMTCFTASFAQTRGLGEVVVSESPTGAIGWFGSSGVGWIINDYLLIQPMLRRLLEDDRTVGEIINIARMEYFLANSGYDYLKPSMLFQYNYLGDPTTRLLLPFKSNDLVSEKSIYAAGEQLMFNYMGESEGELSLLPVNATGHPWWTTPHLYETAQIDAILVNQENDAPTGLSRAIYTIDRGIYESALQGYVQYSISSDWFEHEPPTADELSGDISTPLRVKYHSNSTPADSLVIVFSGGNQDRYSLSRIEDYWEFSGISNLSSGSSPLSYSFNAYAAGVYLQNSPSFRLYLPADITLSVNALRSGVEENQCGIFIDYRMGGVQTSTGQLQYDETSSNFNQSFNREVVLREGNNSIFIPTFFDDGSTTISVTISTSYDSNVSDNLMTTSVVSDYYQILPGIGITFDGENTDSLSTWSDQSLYSIRSDSSWIQVHPYQSELSQASGVGFYQDSLIYEIKTSSESVHLQLESPKQLFQKRQGLDVWQIIPAIPADIYPIMGTGLVAMGQKQDFTGPSTSMMIEGQLFFEGDYILENSEVNLLAEDINGFTWDIDAVNIIVDGTTIDPVLGDTSDTGRIISVSAPLDLEVGEHSITYSISDALGNWSEEITVSAVVAGNAEIIDYGNFPNPFEGETLIIYELTQPLEDVVIDIFTLSGYKLHTIDQYSARVSIALGAIGYHEVPWNGRDRHEDFVANGVYFYRIKGLLADEELVGPIGKMVKNR